MAEVKFKRIQDSADINNIPVVDGQLIYTKDGKQFMDYETDRVNLGGSGGYTLLWENESPTSSFSSQDITLDSSNYDMYIVLSRYNTVVANNFVVSAIGCKGIGVSVDTTRHHRSIFYTNATTLNVGDCYDSSTSNVDNTYLIPMYVIGINTGLFGE